MDGYQVRPPGLGDDRDKRKVDDFSGLYGLDTSLRQHQEHTGERDASAAPLHCYFTRSRRKVTRFIILVTELLD